MIPPGAPPDQVRAFDTGPGNMVIDALAREYAQGKLGYDRGGKIAASGKVVKPLLEELLADGYYRKKPPKTAGREQYGAEFIARLKKSGFALQDLIATATVLTAATIARGAALLAFPPPVDLIAAGGGVHNPYLMAHLASLMPEAAISTTADYGIHPDAKEAVAFAVLAHRTLAPPAGQLTLGYWSGYTCRAG